MALRFSKRLKIAPGVKINIGLKGISTTIGGRGTSVSVGKKGTHLNVGLPGTGLSTRTKLSGAASRTKKSVSRPVGQKPATFSKYFLGGIGIMAITGALIWIF
jgi:hypothetical protein